MWLVVDGPEKAGKSTLTAQVAIEWCERMGKGSTAWRKHWGPVASDVEYKQTLEKQVKDMGPNKLIIWDRSWASEYAYGLMLNRPGRRLVDDPWLGEWLYGRAIQAAGLRVMLTADVGELESRRDETDLPVDPRVELAVFNGYAQRFSWAQFTNDYTEATLKQNARDIVNLLLQVLLSERAHPPVYAGPPDAKIVVVGERRNEATDFPGAWLPLSTPLTTNLGRSLGDDAFKLGWTNAHDIPPGAIRGATALVALGEKAQTWCKFHVGGPRVLELKHPAWLYRYGQARNLIEPSEKALRDLVSQVY